MLRNPRHRAAVFVALAILAGAVCVGRMLIGPAIGEGVPRFAWPRGDFFTALAAIFFHGEHGFDTITSIRLMRVTVGVLAGVALSTSGVALQTLLRNPLAEPFILGLSSGAAVGFVMQRMIESHVEQTLGPTWLGAMAGAVVVLAVVYLLGRKHRVVDPLGMILAGVVLNTVNGAIIMILWQFAPVGDMVDLSHWMMGALEEGLQPATMRVLIIVTVLGMILLLFKAPAMDVTLLSDGEAMSLGVNLATMRTMLFVTASVLAAAAVVAAGPLAFVGLTCPHIARLLLGPGHRALLPAAAMLGVTLVVGADAAVAAGTNRHFPIGVFTAIIGGPVFLWLLRPQLGRGAA